MVLFWNPNGNQEEFITFLEIFPDLRKMYNDSFQYKKICVKNCNHNEDDLKYYKWYTKKKINRTPTVLICDTDELVVGYYDYEYWADRIEDLINVGVNETEII